MCAQTEKTTFSCKDNSCKALHIYWSGGKGLVHSRSTHGAGHIPLCGIFIVLITYCVHRHVCKYSSMNLFKYASTNYKCITHFKFTSMTAYQPKFSLIRGRKETISISIKIV